MPGQQGLHPFAPHFGGLSALFNCLHFGQSEFSSESPNPATSFQSLINGNCLPAPVARVIHTEGFLADCNMQL
jgi:hypothetical protein